MSYCDSQGMIARFGEDELIKLTDTGDTGRIDDNVLTAALSDASDEIDSYLAVRHALPLAETPDLLIRLCADITRYRLYDDRMLEEVEKRYEKAVGLLKSIARGTAVLPVQQPLKPSTEFSTSRSQADRVFTSESLRDF